MFLSFIADSYHQIRIVKFPKDMRKLGFKKKIMGYLDGGSLW